MRLKRFLPYTIIAVILAGAFALSPELRGQAYYYAYRIVRTAGLNPTPVSGDVRILTTGADRGLYHVTTAPSWVKDGTAWYNVKEFGAVGDGTTDDTLAIQATLDAVDVAGGGGVVYLPKGEYRITNVLVIGGSGITVTGDGSYYGTDRIGTRIRQYGVNRDALRVVGNAGESIVSTTIQHLSLWGNRYVPGASSGSGIMVIPPAATVYHEIIVDDVVSLNWYDSGMVFYSAVGHQIFDVTIRNYKAFYNRLHGLNFYNTLEVTIDTVFTSDNDGDALHIYGEPGVYSENFTINRFSADTGPPATYFGFWFEGVINALVTDSWLESTPRLVMLKSVRGIRFEGGAWGQTAASAAGIYIDRDVTPLLNAEIFVNVPGWTNTPGVARITFAGAGPYFTQTGMHLNTHADGTFTPADVQNYTTWAPYIDFVCDHPPPSVTFANLGTIAGSAGLANGMTWLCSDCTNASPCAGAGTGAFAKRLNGIWRCD